MNQLDLQKIETIRIAYPAYQRYWCCGRTIGTLHGRTCPLVPTAKGPLDDEDDVLVEVEDA
jgi:hypothetical protein